MDLLGIAFPLFKDVSNRIYIFATSCFNPPPN